MSNRKQGLCAVISNANLSAFINGVIININIQGHKLIIN
uniref:Uncharacterized protein n=1 Tax=Anguilla anguilla TaxID=7936 RepID=A0A0E9SSL5_ANGAN